MISANTLDAVFVDVDELMGFKEAFDVRPELGKDCIESRSPQVSKTQVNDFPRRFAENDPVGKVRIFGDYDEIVFAGVRPKGIILNAGAKGGRVNSLGVLKAGNAGRKILVEEKSVHLTETTE